MSDECKKCGSCGNKTLRGPRGPQGEKGVMGAMGPMGPMGPAGQNGQNGQDGQDGLPTAINDTTTVNLNYDTSGVLTANVQDTGWVPLLGFNHHSSDPNMLIPRPAVRRIGNVLHFRGIVSIPLENGESEGNVITWMYQSGENTYEGTLTGPAHGKKPYTGVNGVNISTSGNLTFNKGVSVIPNSVLPLGYQIDHNYSLGWRMGYRPMSTGSCTTLLTTLANIAITTGGQLVWGCHADLEESVVSGCNPGAMSTSAMNYIISKVTEGHKVSDFKTLTNKHSSPSSGVQDIQLDFKVADEYPISIDANNVLEIGGFQMVLDGLIAYIGPCVDTIPRPTPNC